MKRAVSLFLVLSLFACGKLLKRGAPDTGTSEPAEEAKEEETSKKKAKKAETEEKAEDKSDEKTDDKSDASSEKSDKAEIENEEEVKRFNDEVKGSSTSMKTEWEVSTARTNLGEGDIVASLKKATEVTRIATKGDHYLVTFEDPGHEGKKLMGWVSKKVFTPEPKRDASVRQQVTCAKGESPILLEGGGEHCVRVCANDAQCPKGYACIGTGPLSDRGSPGKMIEFCNLQTKRTPTATDAGVVDAAVSPTGDAGVKVDAGTVVSDAGALKLACWAKQKNKACTVPYVVDTKDAVCRLPCTTNAQCDPCGGKCNGKFCISN